MNFMNRPAGVGLTGTTLNINNINITIGDKLADGGYGIIYRCSDMSGKVYALKALQAPDQEHYNAILQEYEIQKRCANHPNIVNVFGMTTNQGTRQAMILMENCPDDLIKHINSVFHQGFDDKTIIQIFTQVCEAVNHMHSLNPPVIHRDLKPENVLRNNGIWKLCDFGSATTRVYRPTNESERNIASDDIQKNTTALYRAPEMCDLYRNQTIDTKADVWALGCILYKLCTFKDAFAEGNNLQILNVKYQWPPNKNINQKFKDIVKYIFETDPDRRPSARDVLGELYRQFPDLVDPKWKQNKPINRNQSSDVIKPNNSSSQDQLPRRNTPTTNFDIFSQNNQSPSGSGPSSQTSNPFNNSSNPFGQQSRPSNPFHQSTVHPPSPFDNPPSSDPFNNPPSSDPFSNPPSSNPFNNPPSSNPFGNPPSSDPFSNPPSSNPFSNPPSSDPFGNPPASNPFNSNNSAPTSTNPFNSKSSQDNSNTYDPFAAIPNHQSSSQNNSTNPFNSNNSTPISNDPFAQGPAPTFTPPASANGSYDPFELAVQQAKQQGKVVHSSDGNLVDVSQEHPAQIPASAKGSQEIEDYSVIGEFSPKQIETDAQGFMKKCLDLDEIQMTSVLYAVNASYPSTLFFFQFLHACGTKVDKVALCLPENIPPPMGPIILSRKSFHKHFPQFEGNFALTTFLKQNKESKTPIKIGDAPICVDAVKELLSHLDKVLTMLRAVPKKEIGDEAFFCYQVTAYLLARLKAYKIKEGYTVETAIPMFKNFHTQFKKAFTLIKLEVNFPQDPFDFNDETFLKRIRPPPSKSLL